MKKGFTLIEVIIAVLIISLMILSISGLVSMSLKMNSEADKMSESFNIARSICEMYKSNTDTYSNPGTEINIYKYINTLWDIQSINDLIINKNGDYIEADFNEIINGSSGFKYTLILKIKKIANSEKMEALWIEIIKNDGELMKISMNAAK